MPLPVNPPATPATLSQNARTVLEKRYLIKNKSGKAVETPEEMFWRVATTVAEPERRYGATDARVEEVANKFYELMTDEDTPWSRHVVDIYQKLAEGSNQNSQVERGVLFYEKLND